MTTHDGVLEDNFEHPVSVLSSVTKTITQGAGGAAATSAGRSIVRLASTVIS